MSFQMLITGKCAPADVALEERQCKFRAKQNSENPLPHWAIFVTDLLVRGLLPRHLIA